MYSAILMWCVAIVAVFPSWAVAGVSVAVAALIVVRTLLEDAMLARELPGYEAYRAQVRWRLVPWLF
jgi:protein-S-isoprenylcysteine O-methyltransferase Ste14